VETTQLIAHLNNNIMETQEIDDRPNPNDYSDTIEEQQEIDRMEEDKLLKEALDSIPLSSKIYIKKMSDIVERIFTISEKKGISEEEIKKIISKDFDTAIYNFKLREIAELEAYLGEDIILITK